MIQLNVILKLVIAITLLIISLVAHHFAYNLLLIASFFFIFIFYRFHIFRFSGQRNFFLLLTLFIIISRALTGYGHILLTLPGGLTVTREGLEEGLWYASQLWLIFLLSYWVFFTSQRAQFMHYLALANKFPGRLGKFVNRLMRISLLIAYLLPTLLEKREGIRARLRQKADRQKKGVRGRVEAVLDEMYAFIREVLLRCEEEYQTAVSRPLTVESPNSVPIGHVSDWLIGAAFFLVNGLVLALVVIK